VYTLFVRFGEEYSNLAQEIAPVIESFDSAQDRVVSDFDTCPRENENSNFEFIILKASPECKGFSPILQMGD
jgi:hypothetical protein